MERYNCSAPIERLGISRAALDGYELAFLGTDSGAIVETDHADRQWMATCRDSEVADFLVQAHHAVPTLLTELGALRQLVTSIDCLLHDQPDDSVVRHGLAALMRRHHGATTADVPLPLQDARHLITLLKSQIGRYLDSLERITVGMDRDHPEWEDGLLEHAIDEANGLLSLRDYVVTVIEYSGGGTEILYRCQAEDRDHAAELAEDAFPDADVVAVDRRQDQ